MPDTSQLIALDGHQVWAYAVVGGDQVRVRLPLDDWVPVGDRPDRWLFAGHVAEVPQVSPGHRTGSRT